ncbi:hypothetical protein ACIBP6_29850 [Nonomuraea terrae]|uniref:hypothetical protein n=1 Tax=Nonomuraea terrae TaxID=2530383 RepID=UPI003797C2F8
MISATNEYVHSDVHETVAHHLGDGRWVVSDMPGLLIDRPAAIRHVMWKEIERGRQIMYEQAREPFTPERARAKVQALLAEARAVLAVGGPVTDPWLSARMDEANYRRGPRRCPLMLRSQGRLRRLTRARARPSSRLGAVVP